MTPGSSNWQFLFNPWCLHLWWPHVCTPAQAHRMGRGWAWSGTNHQDEHLQLQRCLADLSWDMVCHPLRCQTCAGQACAHSRGIFGSIKQYRVLVKYLTESEDPLETETPCLLTVIFPSLYTVFPQVFSTKLQETRVFKLKL